MSKERVTLERLSEADRLYVRWYYKARRRTLDASSTRQHAARMVARKIELLDQNA